MIKKRDLYFSELNAFFHFSISILVSLLSLIERNQWPKSNSVAGLCVSLPWRE